MGETIRHKDSLENVKNDERAIELLVAIFGVKEKDARELWQRKVIGTLVKMRKITETREGSND
jgi:hypothetical protein